MRTFLLAALLAASADVDVKAPSADALVGKPAPALRPDFALNGDRAAVADLKGQVVLVHFWAVWCPHCRPFLATVNRLDEAYRDKGLVTLALTRYYGKHEFKAGKLRLAKTAVGTEDEQAMLKAYAEHYKLGCRVQTVPPDDFRAWKIDGIPATLVIDRKGVVRLAKVSNTSAAARQIEATVKELLAE